MKFIKWLFNFAKRYRKQIKSYRESGIAGKITTTLLSIAFVGVSIVTEVFAINLLKTNFLLAVPCFIGFIIMACFSLPQLIVNSVAAFISAFATVAEGAMENVLDKTLHKTLGAQIGKTDLDETSDADEVVGEVDDDDFRRYRRTPKWFDILIGILSALLAIGVFVSYFVIFFLMIKAI